MDRVDYKALVNVDYTSAAVTGVEAKHVPSSTFHENSGKEEKTKTKYENEYRFCYSGLEWMTILNTNVEGKSLASSCKHDQYTDKTGSP